VSIMATEQPIVEFDHLRTRADIINDLRIANAHARRCSPIWGGMTYPVTPWDKRHHAIDRLLYELDAYG